MAQEEHILSSSHSGGGGGDSGGVSSDKSRNVKQKKIPQRGLGVAQLEKIRVEEQRKKEALEAANVLANNAVSDASFGASLPPSPGVSFQSPNTVYRSSPSIPIQINGGVDDNTRLYNHRSAAFRAQRNLRSESNAALPLPHRFFRFHQPAPPVVNMEPPSNQNMHCDNYASSLPEEYKMVGMKRPYPFSLEGPPARSFTTHFDPSSVAFKSNYDELPSCSSGYTAQTEPRNDHISYSRDGPSNLSPPPEQIPREVLRDDGRLNGDFLTLAPPLSPGDSKHKYPMDYSGSQGLEENQTRQVHHLGPSRSREEPFSFFPVRSDIDETGAGVTNANGEKGETIDLNLKL